MGGTNGDHGSSLSQSNPPKNLNSNRVHSKSKINVRKEKPDFKQNMSFGAQSKPTQEMGTITIKAKLTRL
jgi:hypothetical protein